MLRSVVWSTERGPPVASASASLMRERRRRPQRAAVAVFVETLAHLETVCGVCPLQTDSAADAASAAAYQSCPHHLRVDSALPEDRRERKRIQLQFMIHHLRALLRRRAPGERTRVVEFCSGSGHIALPLAYLYPGVSVVMIDRNPRAIEIALERIRATRAAMGDIGLLGNVHTVVADIGAYDEPFDVGVSLHACGSASDVALEKCLVAGASFVICPCCIGKVAHSRRSFVSRAMRAAMSCERRFLDLVRAADFGHSASCSAAPSTKEQLRLRCKAFVEEDRRLLAEESGYSLAEVTRMPRDATSKHDVILGAR